MIMYQQSHALIFSNLSEIYGAIPSDWDYKIYGIELNPPFLSNPLTFTPNQIFANVIRRGKVIIIKISA